MTDEDCNSSVDNNECEKGCSSRRYSKAPWEHYKTKTQFRTEINMHTNTVLDLYTRTRFTYCSLVTEVVAETKTVDFSKKPDSECTGSKSTTTTELNNCPTKSRSHYSKPTFHRFGTDYNGHHRSTSTSTMTSTSCIQYVPTAINCEDKDCETWTDHITRNSCGTHLSEPLTKPISRYWTWLLPIIPKRYHSKSAHCGGDRCSTSFRTVTAASFIQSPDSPEPRLPILQYYNRPAPPVLKKVVNGYAPHAYGHAPPVVDTPYPYVFHDIPAMAPAPSLSTTNTEYSVALPVPLCSISPLLLPVSNTPPARPQSIALPATPNSNIPSVSGKSQALPVRPVLTACTSCYSSVTTLPSPYLRPELDSDSDSNSDSDSDSSSESESDSDTDSSSNSNSTMVLTSRITRTRIQQTSVTKTGSAISEHSTPSGLLNSPLNPSPTQISSASPPPVPQNPDNDRHIPVFTAYASDTVLGDDKATKSVELRPLSSGWTKRKLAAPFHKNIRRLTVIYRQVPR
jgi:hypothetical protein